ncbi:hypothetical protein N9917_02360 [Deltaproteobacteria bacterium]|nr:hypothetical protein [Deltaproteobacteria bacterium]
MAVTPKVLIESKYAENSQTTQYTADNVKTYIDKFSVSNNSGAVATIAVNLVVSAGAAGATNLILPAKSIADGEVYTCPELVGQVLDAGGFISTIAGTGSALVIRASGREVS